MARAQTTEAASEAPCSTRPATSTPMSGAAVHRTLASAYRPSPMSSTGRRPKRSATGPHASCAMPKARMRPDIVSCAADIGAPSACDSIGSAGR